MKKSKFFLPTVLKLSVVITLAIPVMSQAVPLLNDLGGSSGYGEFAMQSNDGSFLRNDDGSSNQLLLPFEVNFFGSSFNNFFVNTNGNISFGQSLSTYTPNAFTGNSTSLPPIIAPYWADADTSCQNCGEIYVASPNAETAVVTWNDVGFYDSNSTPVNDFQLILRDRSTTTGNTGDFDIEFRYNELGWTTGELSGGGSDGLGGTEAVAGYDSGTGEFLTLPGSLSANVLELANTSNVSVATPGLWTAAIRNGVMSDGSSQGTPLLPEIVTIDEGFQFEFDIEPDRLIWIDPDVAVGYDYEVTSGPNMMTVTLPDIGDGSFDLFTWNGTEYVDSGIDLTAGIAFDLAAIDVAGLSRFAIRGIEVSADVDPNDPAAFVTGLTFFSAGSVSLNQNPVENIDIISSVPEPMSLVLFGSGIIGLSFVARRDRKIKKEKF